MTNFNQYFEINKYSKKEEIKSSILKDCKDGFEQMERLNMIMIFAGYERAVQAIKNTFPKDSVHQILFGIDLLRKEQYINMKEKKVI
jgi:hypothetical protein